VGVEHPIMKLPAFTLAGLLFAGVDGDKAVQVLEQAFAAGDAAETSFFRKYLPVAGIELAIADGVKATVPLGRDAVGLTLAELYQTVMCPRRCDQRRAARADDTHRGFARRVVRACRSVPDVTSLTEGVTNEDDASAASVYRASRVPRQGFNDAAHESLRRRCALVPARPHSPYALFERARNYERGKAMARKT
jgi:hypothetical protein